MHASTSTGLGPAESQHPSNTSSCVVPLRQLTSRERSPPPHGALHGPHSVALHDENPWDGVTHSPASSQNPGTPHSSGGRHIVSSARSVECTHPELSGATHSPSAAHRFSTTGWNRRQELSNPSHEISPQRSSSRGISAQYPSESQSAQGWEQSSRQQRPRVHSQSPGQSAS